jgi:hypothetical protein
MRLRQLWMRATRPFEPRVELRSHLPPQHGIGVSICAASPPTCARPYVIPRWPLRWLLPHRRNVHHERLVVVRGAHANVKVSVAKFWHAVGTFSDDARPNVSLRDLARNIAGIAFELRVNYDRSQAIEVAAGTNWCNSSRRLILAAHLS